MFWRRPGETTIGTKPTQIDRIDSPSNLVTFFETIRDGTGHYQEVWHCAGEPFSWCSDYQMKWEYNPIARYQKLTGGRHFRNPSHVGAEPWGMDNVSILDGHVQVINMQWLVENGPSGVFYSYPFSPDSLRGIGASSGDRDEGAELWMVPW